MSLENESIISISPSALKSPSGCTASCAALRWTATASASIALSASSIFSGEYSFS